LVTIEEGAVASVEKQELDVLRWAVVHVDLSGAVSADSTIEYVRGVLNAELEKASGRFIATRLVLEGTTQAHTDLNRDFQRWIQEYRSQASSFDNPGIWLEKVQLCTKTPIDIAGQLNRDDALGDLLRLIANLETSPVDLCDLTEEFTDLKNKLPAEISSGDDPFNLADPTLFIKTLPEVKDILLNRLSEEGGRQ
jgi:hypothetical protein